ncbi:ferredoxin [Thiosulfatihalobacter marinus]|uniref:ferredoxin n=1 Tax=Thiosulfatihalobacter marinus TaxID=2792481 RepID=UPI0018D78570|nr:ferredoxin [Thiosulfatihalobacter marinus]
MKVCIDENLCQGHARCVFFAPDVFEIDDEGYANVRVGMENVPADQQDNVRKAAANCPERTIIVTD